MQPKMKLIIGGLLGVLVIVVALFLFRSGDKTGGFSKIVNLEKPSFTNLQMAQKTLTWLNSIKDSKNSYYFGQQCHKNKSCDKALTDKQVGVTVLWSRYQYYKETQDKEELQIIKEHIKTYQAVSFQPDFWHCKLLYEMSQDTVFTTEEKNQLKNMCDRSVYFRHSKALEAKKDINKFSSADTTSRLVNKGSTLIISDSLPQDDREFLIYSAYVSEFVSRYRWLNSSFNLEAAKDYFDNALSYYLQRKNSTLSALPFLTIGALDIYQVTGNKEYLNFASFLTERIENEKRDKTFDLVALSLLEDSFYKLTKEEKYLNNLKSHIALIKKNSFDYLGYNGHRIGKESFHNQSVDDPYYDTRNAALIMSLLTNKDYED